MPSPLLELTTMKLYQSTLPLVILTVVGILYVLQSCGGVHYDSYVADYKDIAMKEMQRTGYPASIKLAQAILESQGGRGKLAFDYNNHFGILCGKNWPGKKYYQEEEDFSTGNKVEICYRVYNKPESSFVAHTDLVRSSFRTLFHKIDPMDYEAWAMRLAELQYSDNDSYDATLINMVERYKLYEFDEIAMGVEDRPIAQEVSDYQEESNYQPDDYYTEREKFDDYGDSKRERDPWNDYEDSRREREALKDYEDRRRERATTYRERLEELEEGIDDHNRRYPFPKSRNRSEGYEEDLSSTYKDDLDYEDLPRRERDSRRESTYRKDRRQPDYLPSSYEEESWEPKKEYTYPTQQNNNTRFNHTNIDEKYEGLSNSKPTYRPSPREYDNYDRPTYEKELSTSGTYSKNRWESANESTSISDFRMPEDYAYINGIKVTTARYDDTPLLVAKRYNVSVKDLIHFNEGIKSTKQLLREDQRVYLEAKKKNYDGNQRYHIVQFGERMEDIANMYGLSLKALYEKNKMPFESEPALGVKIKLDRGKIKKRPELRYKKPKPLASSSSKWNQVPPPTPITGNYSSTSPNQKEEAITTVLLQPVTTNNMYHYVQEGETLYRIAHQYGTTVEAIKNMNHLSQTTIKRGMRLKVK